MKKMGILKFGWNIFSIVLTIILVIALIWFIINPIPVKYVFSYFAPKTIFQPNGNHTATKDYTLYTNTNSKHDKLVVIIPGGAGLLNGIDNLYGFMNMLNENLGDGFDILTFSYPVRFKHTIHDSMLMMNRVLEQFLHYDQVHAIGISFGALLIGAFYNKEENTQASQQMNLPKIGMRFKSFVGVCGMYEPFFNIDLISWLFKVYIMRNTLGLKRYTCYGMSIPRLIISADSDFLVAQSSKFIKTEPCESKIYTSHTLPHAFPQYINLSEAKESIVNISKFIIKNTSL